ncbi:MAG: hypothetical protein JWL84_546 [Rhodospirillales bacterium]|jgi:hypothetical protein|nr:hypothetical protein [Rhodospirillales bacterium]
MADRQNNFSRSEPHLGGQPAATGIGATLVASSEGEGQFGAGEAPVAQSAPVKGKRWESLFARRHGARPLARPAAGPRGLLDQAADVARGATTQIADEFRGAAEAFLDERKTRAAETIRGVADALNHAAGDLARESPPIADYAGRAADRVEEFASRLNQRSWSSIFAEAEALAKQQPTLFLVGAAALGFAMGRLMVASPRGGAAADSEALLDPEAPRTNAGAATATAATGASMMRRENA